MALQINNASLVAEMRATLSQIDIQIREVVSDTEGYIKAQGLDPEAVTVYMWHDKNGKPVLQDLLVAKAQILAGLANLNAANMAPRR